jgi:hypothetical protein
MASSPPPAAAMAALEEWFRETEEIDEYPFDRIGAKFVELAADLAAFDPISCVTAIAALSTLAENRNRMVRLDALLHLAAIHCQGVKQPTVDSLNRWLNQMLAGTAVSRREDPAEDVAIGNIMTTAGNYRVFLGDSSNPDYYAQDVLDALQKAPANLDSLRHECHSLLKVSDLLVERRTYLRNEGEAGDEISDVCLPISDDSLWSLCETVLIGHDQLKKLAIQEQMIAPFTLTFEEFQRDARKRSMRMVRRQPLIQLGDCLLIAHPTSIAWAMTTHVFTSVRQKNMLGSLENSLGGLQAYRTFRLSAREIERQDMLTSKLPSENTPPAKYVSQVAFRFDGNKYIHLLFLHDDVYDIEAKGITANWFPPFRDSLGAYIECSATGLLAEGACTSGLTLIVQGGVWRGCAMQPPTALPDGCSLQVWSSADLDRLMTNERRWKLLLWKYSDQKNTLSKWGVEFRGHSDANMFSMWTHYEYRLIPKSAGIDSPNYVGLGAEFIFNMRADNRRGIDEHCAFQPDESAWKRVRRLNSRSYFREDSIRKTYGLVSPRGNSSLDGVVETEQRSWWVTCSVATEGRYQRDLIYQLWEMVVNWLDRIAPSLDRLVPELGAGNKMLTLDVSEIERHEDWTEDGLQAANIGPAISVSRARANAVIRVGLPFVANAYSPTNEGERELVSGLINAALMLAGVDTDAARQQEIEFEIAMKDDDRFMHLFRARDARDHLFGFDAGIGELLHEEEFAFSALHLAQEASIKAPSQTEDIASTNKVLNLFVDALWKRTETRLRELDRTTVVLYCVTNQERLLRDQDIWQRTSRAVLSLHADREDVLQASQALKQKRDRTQISQRVLIEMAICTCPLENGRPATQADLDYLGAQVALLIATAAHSDAIRGGCTQPSMQISRLGDYSLEDNFMGVMFPYLTSHFERVHMADVNRYEEWFEPEPAEKKPEEEVFGETFVAAFKAEYGISPARVAEIGVLLAEDATEQQSTVIHRTSDSLRRLLAKEGISEEEITGFWTNFILKPRERWDTAKKPYLDKDWYPWRFRRHLSLMARPVVDLGNGMVIYAPGFCEDSFRHNVMEAFQGAFDTEYFSTIQMKAYYGGVNDKRGAEFNTAASDLFASQGWNTVSEVEMTALGAPADRGMGDVDVLAWKRDIVCICECKELLFARTVGEVVSQLVRFRGQTGDDLDKHLQRVKFLRENQQELRRVTGIDSPRIISILITSKVVPMQFGPNLGTQVLAADQITADFLNSLLDKPDELSTT